MSLGRCEEPHCTGMLCVSGDMVRCTDCGQPYPDHPLVQKFRETQLAPRPAPVKTVITGPPRGPQAITPGNTSAAAMLLETLLGSSAYPRPEAEGRQEIDGHFINARGEFLATTEHVAKLRNLQAQLAAADGERPKLERDRLEAQKRADVALETGQDPMPAEDEAVAAALRLDQLYRRIDKLDEMIPAAKIAARAAWGRRFDEVKVEVELAYRKAYYELAEKVAEKLLADEDLKTFARMMVGMLRLHNSNIYDRGVVPYRDLADQYLDTVSLEETVAANGAAIADVKQRIAEQQEDVQQRITEVEKEIELAAIGAESTAAPPAKRKRRL